jgi:hypothetical protein
MKTKKVFVSLILILATTLTTKADQISEEKWTLLGEDHHKGLTLQLLMPSTEIVTLSKDGLERIVELEARIINQSGTDYSLAMLGPLVPQKIFGDKEGIFDPESPHGIVWATGAILSDSYSRKDLIYWIGELVEQHGLKEAREIFMRKLTLKNEHRLTLVYPPTDIFIPQKSEYRTNIKLSHGKEVFSIGIVDLGVVSSSGKTKNEQDKSDIREYKPWVGLLYIRPDHKIPLQK